MIIESIKYIAKKNKKIDNGERKNILKVKNNLIIYLNISNTHQLDIFVFNNILRGYLLLNTTKSSLS